jgi:predicted molibdopterin-dependent oxidoreductase YjgC
MPIRGHSGVQGGAEMGAYATAFPGGVAIDAASAARLAERYGFPVGDRAGLNAEEMVLAGGRGEIDVLYSSGGNFLDVLPDPESVEAALARVPVRVHQDIVVTSQMLVDGADAVVLLPACTRYEQRGGGTETTTERRVAFGPEIPGPRVGEARAEWEIFGDLAARVRPDLASAVRFPDADAIRAEIADVVPAYAGVERLEKLGDSVQWGGPRLGVGGAFATPDGKAHFTPVRPSAGGAPGAGAFVLSTRRGKQFNSMVFADRDPLTGAVRDAVLLNEADAAALGVSDGARVVLRSGHGEMPARVHLAPIRAGNVQVFFPEGNVLLPVGIRDVASGVPDYTTRVDIRPA